MLAYYAFKEEEDKVNVSNLDKVKDGKMNSRGLLSPRCYKCLRKNASAKTRTGGKGCRSASFRRTFFYTSFISTGSRTRGYLPFGLPVLRTLFFDECVIADEL